MSDLDVTVEQNNINVEITVPTKTIDLNISGYAGADGEPPTINAGTNIDIDVISPTEITINTVEDDDAALTANSATVIPSQKAVKSYADTKVASNAAITGATKTKITYDAKGLVTAGADATTADIADSLNKRYVTDANLTVIGNTSGTNTGDNATNSQYSGLDAAKVNKAGDTMAGNLNMGTNKLIGGTGVTDVLKLQGTTGNGTSTSPAIQLLTGNNGATTALTVLNSGNVGVGTATPVSPLQVNASHTTYLSEIWLNSGTSNSGPYLRLGTSSSYPHYIGSQFGTNQAWSGLGLVMRDNANQFTSHGGTIRFQTSAQSTKKDVAYTSKTDASKTFSFTADADMWGCYPGSTFTIGANTYTVKAAASDRIVVLESISGEAATGTLTGVSYTPTRMMLDTTGNVGIGTTSPSAKLQVTPTAAVIGQLIKGAAAQTANLFEVQNSAAAKLFQISATGAITTTAYERHIQIDAKADGTVANQPTQVDFGTVGGLQFATTGTKYSYAQFEVPDDWDGTDIYIEIDWFPDSGAMTGTDTVEWVINYRCIAEGESILNGTVKTLSVIDSSDYTQYQTKHTRFTLPFNDANQPITKQDHIYLQVTRNTATANDWAGSATVTAYEVIYNSIGLPTSN